MATRAVSDEPADRHRVDDLVGQQLVVEVDARQRDQAGDEGQLEPEVVVEAAHGHHRARSSAAVSSSTIG